MTATIVSGRKLAALSALTCCALLAWGAPQALAAAPTVQTWHATGVTDTAATLNGKVRTNVALTGCQFEYVTSPAFLDTGFTDLSSGGSAPCVPAFGTIPADNAEHEVTADIARPQPAGIVMYRLVATNGDGSGEGIDEAIGFGVRSFDGEVLDEFGVFENQAGAHPHSAYTEFFTTTTIDPTSTPPFPSGLEWSVDDLKDALVRLPPGVVGNPQAVPTCTQAQLFDGGKCPPESAVGTAFIWFNGAYGLGPGQPTGGEAGLYNMEVPHGTPALLAFNVAQVLTQIYAGVRTGEDYGVDVQAKNAPQTLPIAGAKITVWGAPADPSHDARRYFGSLVGFPSSAPPRPFFTLPTSCIGSDGTPGGPVRTDLTVSGWVLGGGGGGSFLSHDNGGTPVGAAGCNALTYTGPNAPTIEARPTTTVGDAPSGLDVDLRIPQNDSPTGLATAHLRDTTVTLPEGLVVNPSGANGLDGCSLAEFGYTSTDPDGTIHTTPGPAACPDASKQASVEVNSPLLDHPIRGAAYIADPFANPFDSLIALYIAVDDEQTGIVAKLAGEVQLDPNTGRITATFDQNPQLPFESFRLRFFGGAGGALRTPAICGNHTTTSSLTPWSAPDSGPPAEPSDTWAIDQNCANSPAEQPHAPSFDAGVVSPIAGAHSPFVVHLRREDGSQNFAAVTVSPPQGLVAKLAGTPTCSDADLATAASKTGQQEKASPSCPLASEVGSVSAGAGAGPAPYHASGKVYLAGPYKGAPLSLATVIPATAGPFDLGTVVTRIAAHVNSKTAEITAVSDPIPHILQGIPLDVRTVDVSLDKPNFSLNPTSCNVMAVNGLLTSTLGQVASLSSRFQMAECTGLGFKPKMTLRLRGGTKRGKHPALTIALTPRPGDANIASVSVAMPRSEFLENAHIRTVCTRPDFAADQCPAGAIYGESTVDTPLLDYDLAGHVYLRSSDNLLPDVVPDLRGPAHQPIKLETSGRTDSIRGGIRTTIDFVPDAPFTKAIVALQGGSKGLLVNSRNICDRIYRATVKYTAHNGASFVAHPALKAKCGKRGKKGKRRAKRG